jgi:ribosomal-protein-alanine N-acetyltransferase
MNRVRVGAIVLEPQIAAHAVEMFAVLSDPLIYEFENASPESLAYLTERFAKLESRASPDGAEQWLNWVVRLSDGTLAGFVQATITLDRTAQIAYVLAARFWRRGIGTAAVNGMLGELAATYGVRWCTATLKARNHRSRALLQRLGFESSRSEQFDEIVMHKTIDVAPEA